MRILAIILFLAAGFCGFGAFTGTPLTSAEQALITRQKVAAALDQPTSFSDGLAKGASRAQKTRFILRVLTGGLSVAFLICGIAALKSRRSVEDFLNDATRSIGIVLYGIRARAIILFLIAGFCGYQAFLRSSLSSEELALIAHKNSADALWQSVSSTRQFPVTYRHLEERAAQARKARITSGRLSVLVSGVFLLCGFAALKKPHSNPDNAFDPDSSPSGRSNGNKSSLPSRGRVRLRSRIAALFREADPSNPQFALAFLIFFVASAWCWNGLSAFFKPSFEERAFFRAGGEFGLPTQNERLRSLEAEALFARDQRILESTKSALGSGVLLLLGIFVLLKRRVRRRVTFSLPPNPPDIEALMENVKRHPLSLPQQVTHFYESRRHRCRTAREKLKSQIDRLFSSSGSNADSSQSQNPQGLSQEPDPRSII